MTKYAQSFYRNERLNLFIMDNTHFTPEQERMKYQKK